MSVTLDADWREQAARRYETLARPRRWAAPGDLARALDPATMDSRPLQIIDRELVRLADHQVPADGLMVFCAPQEGKSERCARRFPEWLLSHDPALRVVVVSYEAELAIRWGRAIRRDLIHADPKVLDIRLRQDSTAAGRWETAEGGGLYAVGIGGALTGRPANCIVIDDPVKGREEAESAVYRERAWDWYESVCLPRLAPGGIIVLIMTRWQEDDLAGRILARPSPIRWRVLSMPAISDGPGDPLGRPAGEEFPSIRGREAGHFHRLKATTSPYVFASIYQQRPAAVEGNLFRRASFRYWRPVTGQPDPGAALARGVMAGAWLDLDGLRVDLADPATWRFATVDLAASTRTTADWTVVSVWAIARDGDLILLDRARGRVEMADHFAMAKPLRDRWRYDLLYVPHEYWSKTLIVDARAAGVPVAEVITDTDKVTRAIPAAGRLHSGRVWWPHRDICPWLDEWEHEIATFPRAANDDQVDTFSAAARVASAHWLPPVPLSRPGPLAPELERIAAAHAAATGDGHHGPDIMSMPLGLAADQLLTSRKLAAH